MRLSEHLNWTLDKFMHATILLLFEKDISHDIPFNLFNKQYFLDLKGFNAPKKSLFFWKLRLQLHSAAAVIFFQPTYARSFDTLKSRKNVSWNEIPGLQILFCFPILVNKIGKNVICILSVSSKYFFYISVRYLKQKWFCPTWH